MNHDPIHWEVVEDDQGWSPSSTASPSKPAGPVNASAPAAEPEVPLFSPDEVAKAKAATRAAAKATARGAAVAATVGAKLATQAARKSGEGLTRLRAREWKRPTWLRLPHVRHPKRLARIGIALCAVLMLVGAGVGGFHIYRSHQGDVKSSPSDPTPFTPDLSVGVPAEATADELPTIEIPAAPAVEVTPVSAPAFVLSPSPVSLVPVARPTVATVALASAPTPSKAVAKKPTRHVPAKATPSKPTPSKPRPAARPSQAQQVDAWFHQLNH